MFALIFFYKALSKRQNYLVFFNANFEVKNKNGKVDLNIFVKHLSQTELL